MLARAIPALLGNKKGANMKPKRYPYSGNKKQPHEEITKLKIGSNMVKITAKKITFSGALESHQIF